MLTLSAENFREARRTTFGLLHRTPLLSSRSIGNRAGCSVWLKAENLQKTGSFKPRGALNKLRHLAPSQRSRGIITASAGNHGQAVAFVAAHEQLHATVVVPEGANSAKVAAVRGYGADVIVCGSDWDEAYAQSTRLGEERGLVYVHPFNDPYILAGQGTVALEILEDLPDVQTVVVPIGGGGLIAGMALAFKAYKPTVRVVGVEPAGSANMYSSRQAGKAVDLASTTTIADGLATRTTDPEIWEVIARSVDELVLVDDSEMLAAVRFLLERSKLLAEPAGAATVAALLGRKISNAGDHTVAVVSGGNLDVANRLSLRF